MVRRRQVSLLRNRSERRESSLPRRRRREINRRRSPQVRERCAVWTSTAARSTMVYLSNDFKHLDDLYVADLNGRNERQLTNLNESLWKQLQFADVERFTYKSADDWDVDGFLVKPHQLGGRKEVSADSQRSWWTSGPVRRRLVSRVSGLRGERLCGGLHQPARLNRLWSEV